MPTSLKAGNPPSFKVVTWNIGGAKFLGCAEKPISACPQGRDAFRRSLRDALRELTRIYHPDVVLLQETIRYGDPANPLDLVALTGVPGYEYDMSIAIDTLNQPHPQKWRKYFERGGWPDGTYMAQGYGILWRKELRHAPIWEFTGNSGARLEKETVRLETGLFTGSRDSEPRLAVVAHFIIDLDDQPLDLFVVNLHLTTLKGEREGSPARDIFASRLRLGQLELVANGIVSRYNEWASEKLSELNMKRPNAVWVLGGDFNCIPASPEITSLQQMNFIDLNPAKGDGSKGAHFPLERATIALDYLFAGPAYHALDPYLARENIKGNPLPLSQFHVSDHFPVLAEVPLASVHAA